MRSSRTSHDEWCLKLKSEFPTCHAAIYYIPFRLFFCCNILLVFTAIRVADSLFSTIEFHYFQVDFNEGSILFNRLDDGIVTELYVITNDAVRMAGVTLCQMNEIFSKLSSKDEKLGHV